MCIMLYVISGIFFCSCLIFYTSGQFLLGFGKWSVLSVEKCSNDAEMPWRVRARRHKLNRTHDAFDADLSLLDDLDHTYTGRATVCKVVDGGCKPFVNKKDENLSELLHKYGGENAIRALQAIGLDPPDLPIPKGNYHVENYVLNMDELVKRGMYGTYEGEMFIVKNGQDMACIKGSVKFETDG